MRTAAPSRKAGFTLIEAMIALLITGLTVALVLGVGTRGAFQAFGLGNRALATVDKEVDRQTFDDLIHDIVVPPINLASQAAETELELIDDSFVGAPDQMSGRLVAGRETVCAPLGLEGRITLSVETTASLETTVFCRLTLDDGTEIEPVAVAKLRWPDGVFSYSEDGTQWYDSWEVYRGQPTVYGADPNQVMRKIFVRLASSDGRAQIVDLAASGRALSQRVTTAANNNNGNNANGGRGGRGGGPDGRGPGRGPGGGPGAGPGGGPGRGPGGGRGGPGGGRGGAGGGGGGPGGGGGGFGGGGFGGGGGGRGG